MPRQILNLVTPAVNERSGEEQGARHREDFLCELEDESTCPDNRSGNRR